MSSPCTSIFEMQSWKFLFLLWMLMAGPLPGWEKN